MGTPHALIIDAQKAKDCGRKVIEVEGAKCPPVRYATQTSRANVAHFAHSATAMMA